MSHQGDDKAFAELYEPRNRRFLGRDRVAYTKKQIFLYESKLSTSIFVFCARTTCNADRSCEATSNGFREAKDYFSGVDALTGHTRSHPEHDG